MSLFRLLFSFATICLATTLNPLLAQSYFLHQHSDEHAEEGEEPEVPKVFWDKSEVAVKWQLKRLSNRQLLLLEINTDDPVYTIGYATILVRPNMPILEIQKAAKALAVIKSTNEVTEFIAAIEQLDVEDEDEAAVAKRLASIVLKQPLNALTAKKGDFSKAADDDEKQIVQTLGYAGLITIGNSEAAWSKAKLSEQSTIKFLNSLSLVPHSDARTKLRETVVASLDESQSVLVRLAAIEALSTIPTQQKENFELLAGLFAKPDLKNEVVRSLLAIETEYYSVEKSASIAQLLVEQAEAIDPSERTSEDFYASMTLADRLLPRLPANKMKAFRARLRKITVHRVVVHTVEEQMRYDVPWFAVEAGSPVQLVLNNEDLMAHNLVITKPGELISVATEGAAIGESAPSGKAYVPESANVLFATNMIRPETSETIDFTAPTEIGEYPYVCTFPNHWQRMYGVMIVVKDLDKWNKNPVEPKDPTGSDRKLVKVWTMDHFKDDLLEKTEERSYEKGKEFFTEATCVTCHKRDGAGGVVGPDLTDVMARWKGDRRGVLREIIDPSHKIDKQYQTQTIDTVAGKTIVGVVTAEDKASVTIVTPDSKVHKVLEVDIEERFTSEKSLMSKGLLDKYQKEEILDLLYFLTEEQKEEQKPSEATP